MNHNVAAHLARDLLPTWGRYTDHIRVACHGATNTALARPGEAGWQRAATNSDYQLTGRITCPKYGCKYVGTSGGGKLRRYRYYTCFTRARYGIAACDAPRIDADLLDQASIEALIDFHGNTDLILAAIGRSWR